MTHRDGWLDVEVVGAIMTKQMFIVYDSTRDQWREFEADSDYQPHCGNGIHQFTPFATRCACEAMRVPPPVSAEQR